MGVEGSIFKIFQAQSKENPNKSRKISSHVHVSKLSDKNIWRKHGKNPYHKYETKKLLDVHSENRVISSAQYLHIFCTFQ